MTGKHIGVCIGIVLLCGGVRGAEPTTVGGITVSATAWSMAPMRWTVHPDGSVDDFRGAAGSGSVPPFDEVARHLAPTKGRYRAIAQILQPARKAVGKSLPCLKQMTDYSLVTVTWPDGSRLSAYDGCSGKEIQPVLDSVMAAFNMVTAWTKDASILEHKHISTDDEVIR